MIIALTDKIVPPVFLTEAITLLACIEDRRLSDLALANFLHKRKPLYEMLTESVPHYLELEKDLQRVNKSLREFLTLS